MNKLDYLDKDLLYGKFDEWFAEYTAVLGILEGVPYREIAKMTGMALGRITFLKHIYFPGLTEAEEDIRMQKLAERELKITKARNAKEDHARRLKIAKKMIDEGATFRQAAEYTKASLGAVHHYYRVHAVQELQNPEKREQG